MTALLRAVVSRIEQLPPAEQDALARVMQRELEERDAERRRRVGLAALDRLDDLTADRPAVDAVRIARESRGVLEDRTSLPYLQSVWATRCISLKRACLHPVIPSGVEESLTSSVPRERFLDKLGMTERALGMMGSGRAE